MFPNIIRSLSIFCLLLYFFSKPVYSEIIKKIEITGNDRIPEETIIMFSNISKNSDISEKDLNQIIKNLYNTNFFKNISVNVKKNILQINVVEFPIIQEIKFDGIKANKIKDEITKNLILKSRSSFNEIILKQDKNKISNTLKTIGYYFSTVDVFVIDRDNNKVDITYKINLGKKAKIKKIKFIGNKIFKNNKLKSLITSEEYKFWKFISGKKFLNQALIDFDKQLLKNYYLNKGYYNVEINSSFAKIINEDEFELIFNINANDKYYFNDLNILFPKNFDENNFQKLTDTFKELKGKYYSINSVNKILDKIDLITLNEEFLSTSATVNEEIIENKINLTFEIKETDKYIVQQINIFGNNVTRENVIRNQLEIDEGDIYNDILQKKSLNNIKSLRFFKSVKDELITDEIEKSKVINITVEEKPTGEISAGAGVGTDGTTIAFGIRENNYLGKGLKLNSNIVLSEESVKGQFGVTNPNYNNSDKLVYATALANETDRLTNFGYKTNKAGFEIGVEYEYLDDLNLGLSTSSFYENIETSSSASARQKKQKGNYWDSFVKMVFDYDKRNQKFQTSDGFRSTYSINLPVISDTNTITNSYRYKVFKELYENNVSSINILLKSAVSPDSDVKLSERLYIPSRDLRGFESGKIGPKDGNDFVGGNFATTINFTTTVPQLLQNVENMDFVVFFDAANLWGVDYSSALNDNGEIRSSVGLGIDWMTVIGPMNFSLAQPLTKSSSDITETFRFNIGTTF